jgi:hypothetical protein
MTHSKIDWHDTLKDRTILKIIRVLPPGVLRTQTKVNSAMWERAIADRYVTKFICADP